MGKLRSREERRAAQVEGARDPGSPTAFFWALCYAVLFCIVNCNLYRVVPRVRINPDLKGYWKFFETIAMEEKNKSNY